MWLSYCVILHSIDGSLNLICLQMHYVGLTRSDANASRRSGDVKAGGGVESDWQGGGGRAEIAGVIEGGARGGEFTRPADLRPSAQQTGM